MIDMPSLLRRTVPALLFLLVCWPTHAAEPPRVVVSIKPLHDIVSGLLEGVAEPELLLPTGASPHQQSLRPSQMRVLQQADLVIWVGPELESFLVRPLAAQHNKQSFPLLTLSGINRLSARSGGAWSDSASDPHEHHAGPDHVDRDPHLWLDPENARIIVSAVAEKLCQLDPGRTSYYRQQAEVLKKRLAELDQSLRRRLASLPSGRHLVFHDSYQYFESRYGLKPAGALSIHPERSPGARRITELRDLIRRNQVVCVFTEPQFEPRLVRTLVEGTSARSGVLDPLGTTLPKGADSYFRLLEDLAANLSSCLQQNR